MINKQKNKGFTLLEVLIAVALIAIFAAAVIFSNPGERLARARDYQREIHLQTIYSTLEQYMFRANDYPICLQVAETEVDFYECQDLVPEYINSILMDPACGDEEEQRSGYTVVRDNKGRVGVFTQCSETMPVITAGSYQFHAEEEEEEVWACGDNLTDTRDSVEYTTLEIANICIMGENLNYETESSWCYDDESSYCSDYGRLYSPQTLSSICPHGWQVITDTQLQDIEEQLGVATEELDNTGFRGSDEGARLAGESSLWEEGVLKESLVFANAGVNLLPTGYRESEVFTDVGNKSYLWTATQQTGSWWARYLDKEETTVGRDLFNDDFAFAVRCVLQ